MNVKQIACGESSFQAAGLVRTTLHGVTAFFLGTAMQKTDQNDGPVFDAATLEALGDNGLPKPIKLNADELVTAMAAGFVLCARHAKKKDPDTGRSPEQIVRYMSTPLSLLDDGKPNAQGKKRKGIVSFQVDRNAEHFAAQAAALKVDAKEVIAKFAEETRKRLIEKVTPYHEAFVKSIKDFESWSDEDLVDLCEEAIVNVERVPALECKRAAQAVIDAQRKALTAGRWVSVDAGVLALAGMSPAPVVLTTEEPQAATAAA